MVADAQDIEAGLELDDERLTTGIGCATHVQLAQGAE
jgi:hypothetical protein